jgi:hypothetical protein
MARRYPGDDVPIGSAPEAYGCLVALAVFKTDVTEDLGQAGSIPVRLRQATYPHRLPIVLKSATARCRCQGQRLFSAAPSKGLARMHKFVYAAAISAAVIVAGAAPALAAAGEPQRPAGPVVPVAPSDNGGDNGWGNCGHNSSRGNPHSDPAGGGNGGYKKGDDCGIADQTNPTDPDDGGIDAT